MKFISDFLRNLIILIIAGAVLYALSPDIMGTVFKTYGMLFGPIGLLMLVVWALPRRSRR